MAAAAGGGLDPYKHKARRRGRLIAVAARATRGGVHVRPITAEPRDLA